MGFVTSQFDYKLGDNFAIIRDGNLTGSRDYIKGGKVKDKGVYEITFVYSVRKSDAPATGNPHFNIGFGTFTSSSDSSYSYNTLVRLGADSTASQNYPNQRSVTVWVTKDDDVELDFLCSEKSSRETWYMYNIGAVAKKIADI